MEGSGWQLLHREFGNLDEPAVQKIWDQQLPPVRDRSCTRCIALWAGLPVSSGNIPSFLLCGTAIFVLSLLPAARSFSGLGEILLRSSDVMMQLEEFIAFVFIAIGAACLFGSGHAWLGANWNHLEEGKFVGRFCCLRHKVHAKWKYYIKVIMCSSPDGRISAAS